MQQFMKIRAREIKPFYNSEYHDLILNPASVAFYRFTTDGEMVINTLDGSIFIVQKESALEVMRFIPIPK